jgi:peptidoglycan/xylan/chitin deacetylase (PgdA/CDA1 family)
MLYNPRLHSFSLFAKGVLGRFEKLRGGLSYPNAELLVLNYHSTPKKYISCFREQLRFLTRHFTVIAPSDLPAYFAGTLETSKCKVLLTFDDGLRNNLYAVDEMNEFGLKAYFFVVPAFIDALPADQMKYYVQHIRPHINPRIDSQPEDFTALSWADLRLLASRGHTVGAHTYTHTLVASASGDSNSAREIESCKSVIEEALREPVLSFCSINNTLQSVGSREKKIIAANYRYHFTTLPGSNSVNKDPLFIKRRNVECFWPSGAFLYAIGQSDLKRWRAGIEAYEAL